MSQPLASVPLLEQRAAVPHRDRVLLELIDSMPHKKVLGWDAYHSLVYFLQRAGVDLGFSFVFHFLGPYSFGLNDYLHAMEMSGAIMIAGGPNPVELTAIPMAANATGSGQQLPDDVLGHIHRIAEALAPEEASSLELLAAVDFLVSVAKIGDEQEVIRCLGALTEGTWNAASVSRALRFLRERLGFEAISQDGEQHRREADDRQ